MQALAGPNDLQSLFGLPAVGEWWQSLLIMGATVLVALLTASRARDRGISATPIWNQLTLGLLIALPLACALVLAARQVNGRALIERFGPGQIAVMVPVALLGGLALLVAMRWKRLPLLLWLDVCAAPLLLSQAIGRLASSSIAQAGGDPRSNLSASLPSPAILDALLWDLCAVAVLVWVERRYRTRLRPGDSVLLAGLLYSLGHVFIAGMRFLSSCLERPAGAGCAAAPGAAQLVSLAVFAACAALLSARRAGWTAAHREADRRDPRA